MATHSSILVWWIPWAEELTLLLRWDLASVYKCTENLSFQHQFVVVQSLSYVQFFATPWTAACQASCYFTISWNLLRFMSIELIMLSISSSAAFFACPQSFPTPWSFPVSQVFATIDSASVLPMNIQGWFPLRLTGLISLQSKGLSRVFSSSTIRWYQFFGAQFSLWSNSHIHTWVLENHSFDYMDLCWQNNVFAF